MAASLLPSSAHLCKCTIEQRVKLLSLIQPKDSLLEASVLLYSPGFGKVQILTLGSRVQIFIHAVHLDPSSLQLDVSTAAAITCLAAATATVG